MCAGNQIWRWLAAIVVLIPPVILAFLISKYSVNVPLWDQWEPDIAGVFVKASTGHLTFADLAAQHNEAKLLFPRIFFLLLGKLTHWNVRYEMAATFLAACAILAMVYRLEISTFSDKPEVRFAVIFLSSMLIFSPAMYEAWLWGLEIVCYIPLACILGGLLLSNRKFSPGMRLVGCAILATISTYSFGNGLLAWIVLFPALFCLKDWEGSLSRKRAIAAWLACFAVNEALYFYGYHHPPQLRTLPELAIACLQQPAQSACFFFAFFGAPLVLEASDPLPAAVAAGVVFIALGIVVGLWIVHRRTDRVLMNQCGPWLVIGTYSILSGALATVTRSAQFGPSEAMSSRYGIFAVAFLVALVHLVPLLAFDELSRRNVSRNTVRTTRTVLGMLAAVLITMHCVAFPAAVWDMRSTWQYRVLGKSWLAFIYVIPEQQSLTELLYPKYELLKHTATDLQKFGFLRPPPFTEDSASLFQNSGTAGNEPLGRLESSRRVAGGNIAFTGWAVAPSRARETDAVVLTYERASSRPQPFTLMNDRGQRPDFAMLGGEEPYYYAGWQAVCSLTNLPKDLVTVKAWGYDSERQIVWPLDGAEEVDNR